MTTRHACIAPCASSDTFSYGVAVLAFSEVLADKGAHGKYILSLYDSGRYMRLDAAAQRALHVVRGRGDANDSFSLTGLLNKGRTPMGKRLCKVQSILDIRYS